MDLTSHGKEQVSPSPDPAPRRPARFAVPPGAVDTANAHRLYGFPAGQATTSVADD